MKNMMIAPVFAVKTTGKFLNWDTGTPILNQEGYKGRVVIYLDGGRTLFDTAPSPTGRSWTVVAFEEGPKKSAGHIGFHDVYEYYERRGEVYKAPLSCVFDGAYRIGRWECARTHFDAYRDTVYSFLN